MEREKLFTLKNPKSFASEAFRTLRTNIQFANIDKDVKTIVVTSSDPREGKTTVSCNLAVSIAQTDKRVLLVDCDMRKPRIHKVFGISNSVGLTGILMGEKKIEDVAYKDKEKETVDGREKESKGFLSVVTSGPIPPNPAELLGSTRMKEFLKSMRELFDIIILDSPPVNAVTDSAILSTIADATILVVESGETDIGAAVNAKELLEKVDANLIGVVLNKVPTKGVGNYGYGYYQYGDYYEDDDNAKSNQSRQSKPSKQRTQRNQRNQRNQSSKSSKSKQRRSSRSK